jgi:hypothetical protein
MRQDKGWEKNKKGDRDGSPFSRGAGDGIRTRDIFLGKEVLYH